MKKIGLVCLMLFFSMFCFAEENSESNTTLNETTQNSVEEEKNGITGFYGIPFKTKKDEVIKIMKEKGWKQSDKGIDKSFGDYLSFKNGIYATKKLAVMTLSLSTFMKTIFI